MISQLVFASQNFASHGIQDVQTSSNLYYRVPQGAAFPINDEQAVRTKIRDLIWRQSETFEKAGNRRKSDFMLIQDLCRIPADTTKKTVSGRCRVTRRFLAKFCVGLKIDLIEANELFRLHSGELNTTNSFDYILYHALKDKDDISDFIDEVKRYCHLNLDRDSE